MTVLTPKKKLVLQAVQTIRELNKKYYEDSSKKKPLLHEEGKSTLYLQAMMKKIPASESNKMIKVNLPHSLVKDSDEICLITGDLDKQNHKAEIEPDVLYYKALLEKHGITNISQVMTLRQLRTEYKPYEAKQKLLAAYDAFLADSRIAECLPSLLGKHFFKKRKFPIQINLNTSNLKQQIEKALSKKVFYITGQGNACTSEVAYLDMADSEILENVSAMCEALSNSVPGTWCNIMGIYLKTAKSKAIPIYVSYDSPNDIHINDDVKDDDVLIDDLSTIPDVKVKVYSSGKVETVYDKEDMEISAETCVNDKEKNTKEEKSNKNSSCANPKKKNVKQELTSPNLSQDKASKMVRSDETKPVKQKKKSTEKKPLSPDQSVQQMTRNEGNKKGALKRKRIESESTVVDSELAVNETPIKPTKKRKIEGVNMKKFKAMKESKKSKRKNQQRNKQCK